MGAGFMTMQQHPNCCSSFAAANTSAPVRRIMDTVCVAVSIFVLIAGLLPVLVF